MKKLSDKDKVILVVMAAVVILGGLFWFYVKPARADLTAAKERVSASQENVDRLTTELNSLISTGAKGGDKRQNVADTLRLAKAYPSGTDVPEAILQLERLARQAGVSFTDGTPDSGTDIAGTTGTAFEITVSGSYFRVLDFVSRLHSQVTVEGDGRLQINGRLFAITSADLESDSESTGRITPSSTVTATITAIAFSRTPAAPADPTATPVTNPTSGGPTQ